MQLPQRPQLRIALERAQARTTAPIHVAVSSLFWGSVRNFGDAAFRKLAISACPERNGVLLLIVPRRRRFVVLGDLAVHARVGQRQWDTLAATIASAAAPQQGYPYAYAIAQLGNLLALHYPSSNLADAVASSSPVSSTAGSTAGTARRGDDEFEIAFEDQKPSLPAPPIRRPSISTLVIPTRSPLPSHLIAHLTTLTTLIPANTAPPKFQPRNSIGKMLAPHGARTH